MLTIKIPGREEMTLSHLILDYNGTIAEDGLIIEGRALTGGTVDGANDHRIVMSAAIAALRAAGDVTIFGSQAVAKSYPTFFELIKSAD